MGSITLTFDREHDLTIATAEGQVSSDQFITTFRGYFEGSCTSRILWNFLRADLRLLTHADIVEFAAINAKYVDLRVGGKTAMVFASDLGYGIGRMYEQYHDERIEHRSFRDLKEAMDWILQ